MIRHCHTFAVFTYPVRRFVRKLLMQIGGQNYSVSKRSDRGSKLVNGTLPNKKEYFNEYFGFL